MTFQWSDEAVDALDGFLGEQMKRTFAHAPRVRRLAARKILAVLLPVVQKALDERDAHGRKLAGAARAVLDPDPCEYDHHGLCQAHSLTSPCTTAELRAALAASPWGDER